MFTFEIDCCIIERYLGEIQMNIQMIMREREERLS